MTDLAASVSSVLAVRLLCWGIKSGDASGSGVVIEASLAEVPQWISIDYQIRTLNDSPRDTIRISISLLSLCETFQRPRKAMEAPHTFPIVAAALDLRGEQYAENRNSWTPVIERHEASLQQVASEGSSESTSRHQFRGQILARDRIALLLDPGSPFLELAPFAGFQLKDSNNCANLIAGIGCVSGRLCLVLSHIPTQSGGAWNELTVRKQNRVTEIATENRLPIVGLVQSAGVFLPQQFRVFHIGGQIFRDLAQRSHLGLASCAVVFGSSTAGGAYHPALSDYTIFVGNQAQVFLGGPPLVKMATGEIVDAEELGGAKMHATVTGLADQLAVDE